MDVTGSLKDALRHERKLKNSAWKCYDGLTDQTTPYAKEVLFLHNIHEQILDMYEHFIGEWKHEHNQRQSPQGPDGVIGDRSDSGSGDDSGKLPAASENTESGELTVEQAHDNQHGAIGSDIETLRDDMVAMRNEYRDGINQLNKQLELWFCRVEQQDQTIQVEYNRENCDHLIDKTDRIESLIDSMDKRFSEADKAQIRINTEVFDRLNNRKDFK